MDRLRDDMRMLRYEPGKAIRGMMRGGRDIPLSTNFSSAQEWSSTVRVALELAVVLLNVLQANIQTLRTLLMTEAILYNASLDKIITTMINVTQSRTAFKKSTSHSRYRPTREVQCL